MSDPKIELLVHLSWGDGRVQRNHTSGEDSTRTGLTDEVPEHGDHFPI